MAHVLQASSPSLAPKGWRSRLSSQTGWHVKHGQRNPTPRAASSLQNMNHTAPQLSTRERICLPPSSQCCIKPPNTCQTPTVTQIYMSHLRNIPLYRICIYCIVSPLENNHKRNISNIYIFPYVTTLREPRLYSSIHIHNPCFNGHFMGSCSLLRER